VALQGSNMGNTDHWFVRKVLPAALLGTPALLLALAAPGCVDNNVTLYIQQVQAPDPSNNCSVSNDPGATYYGTGVMDTQLATGGYVATLLVANQLKARGNSDTMRPESNRVQLYQADVELFDGTGGSLSSFSMPVSGFIDVSESTTPAYGLATVTLVDPATAASLAGQQTTVTARVKVYGQTLGGIDVETGYWDYTIQVCAGCLGCICPSSSASDLTATCFPGDNESVDCRAPIMGGCYDTADHCGCIVTAA
jgi:hypothetical protein